MKIGIMNLKDETQRLIYIQQYIHNELEGEVLDAFLQEMDNDEELAEEVAFSQNLKTVLAYNRDKEYLEDLQALEKELYPDTIKSANKKLVPGAFWKWGIGAVVIILGVWAWSLLQPKTTDALSEIDPYPIEIMADLSSPMWLEAKDAYLNGHYKKASNLLDSIQKEEKFTDHYPLLLYKSVATLYGGNAEAAITDLNELLQKAEFELVPEANLYLAVAYFKNKDYKKANEIVEQLLTVEDNYIKDQAQELKSMLDKQIM